MNGSLDWSIGLPWRGRWPSRKGRCSGSTSAARRGRGASRHRVVLYNAPSSSPGTSAATSSSRSADLREGGRRSIRRRDLGGGDGFQIWCSPPSRKVSSGRGSSRFPMTPVSASLMMASAWGSTEGEDLSRGTAREGGGRGGVAEEEADLISGNVELGDCSIVEDRQRSSIGRAVGRRRSG